MGYSWEHVPHSSIALRLDEHGGDKEQRHQQLAGQMKAELEAAVKAIAAKPEYAEIIGYTDFE